MKRADVLPNSGGAVDLGLLKRASDERAEADAAAEQRAALESLVVFDRGMQRLFKGIIPRPQRRQMMTTALAQMADEDFEPHESNYKLRKDAPRKRRGPGGGGKRR